MTEPLKPNEILAAEVAELKKALAAKGDAISKDEIAKMVKELSETIASEKIKAVEQDFAKRQADLVKQVRKGKYSDRRESEKLSHSNIIEKSDNPAIRELQNANDDLYILSKILECHPQDLKTWQKFNAKHSDLRKAMDSATASEGLEWIPTDFSAELIDRVRLERKVSALFSEINMPTDPYKIPALTSDSTAYLVSEQTADDPAVDARTFTASKPATTNHTMNAIKLGIRTNFSLELEEDSIIPVMSEIKRNMSLEIARALEDAYVNGDTAGSHMDANVTSSADARKAWDGIRKAAQSANNTSLATFSADNLRVQRAKMGRYGVAPSKLAYVCSMRTYVKHFLALDEVLTLEKYGPQATVLTGELARFDNIPIIVSEVLLDDKNTSGVNDATTADKGVLILCYREGWLAGQRRKVTLKSFDDIQNDQIALVTSWRGAFMAKYTASTNPISVAGVAIA